MSLAAEIRNRFVEVEKILNRFLDGERLTGDDELVLRSNNIIDTARAQVISRLKKVRALQSAAGTEDEREAATQLHTTAEQNLANEREELQDTIWRAQKRLAQLNDAVTETARICEKQSAALTQLQNVDLLPAHVRADYDVEKNKLAEIMRALHSSKTRLQSINQQLGLTDEGQIHDWLRNRGGEFWVKFASVLDATHLPTGQVVTKVNMAGWRTYCLGLQSESVELSNAISALESEAAEQKQVMQDLLRFYVGE